MKYLIIGGSKSGKSEISEKIALSCNKNKVLYIATMKPYDSEDRDRIEDHIKRRENLNFITLEKHRNLSQLDDRIQYEDTILIDSITSLLTNEMFVRDNIIKTPSNNMLRGLESILSKAKNTIIVSDYIFSDSIIYDEITEIYKRELGMINRKLAQSCDVVIECRFGNIKYHKVPLIF